MGNLSTETMLIKGINTSKKHIKEIADFLETIKINTAYISIPTRPPTSKRARVPDEATINMAYNLLKERNLKVKLLSGYSQEEFPGTKNVSEAILNITSVHPMREKDVQNILDKSGENWKIVEDLLVKGELKMVNFGGNKFFLRSFKRDLKDGKNK